jgi:hypothetical protein
VYSSINSDEIITTTTIKTYISINLLNSFPPFCSQSLWLPLALGTCGSMLNPYSFPFQEFHVKESIQYVVVNVTSKCYPCALTTAKHEHSSCSTSLPTLKATLAHRNWFSLCGFNLPFLKEWWCWVVFCVLLCHFVTSMVNFLFNLFLEKSDYLSCYYFIRRVIKMQNLDVLLWTLFSTRPCP